MIKSMTGFGRSEYSDGKRNIIVEIRSVNHRYCDISVKMPRRYSFAEDKAGNIYVGGWHGLSVIYSNGKGFSLANIDSLDNAHVQRITLASDGSVWLTTRNTGFIHLTVTEVRLLQPLKA